MSEMSCSEGRKDYSEEVHHGAAQEVGNYWRTTTQNKSPET
jgi:hypothetical protein